jgi:hypothetical protein
MPNLTTHPTCSGTCMSYDRMPNVAMLLPQRLKHHHSHQSSHNCRCHNPASPMLLACPGKYLPNLYVCIVSWAIHTSAVPTVTCDESCHALLRITCTYTCKEWLLPTLARHEAWAPGIQQIEGLITGHRKPFG